MPKRGRFIPHLATVATKGAAYPRPGAYDQKFAVLTPLKLRAPARFDVAALKSPRLRPDKTESSVARGRRFDETELGELGGVVMVSELAANEGYSTAESSQEPPCHMNRYVTPRHSRRTAHKDLSVDTSAYKNKSAKWRSDHLAAGGGIGTNLYDDPIIEGQPAPSSPTYAEQLVDASLSYPVASTLSIPRDCTAVGLDFCIGCGLDRCAASTLDTSNKPLLAALTIQYQEGERVFRESHKRMLNGLGKFLRLEYHDKDWALRERALTIERELQQEFHEIEAELHGTRWLLQHQ